MARVEWNGDQVRAAIEEGAFEGLQLAGQHLLQVSSALVPHEEGDLERSGDTDEDRGEGAVSVFYDRPYAVIQHEELSYNHDDGRTSKYLETPMHTEKDVMLKLIASAASKAV